MHRYATVEEYVSAQPQPLCDIGLALLPVLGGALAGAEPSLWHGHPTWRVGGRPVCAVKAYTRHVSFELWGGDAVEDPSGRLRPVDGGGRAFVKLRTLEDVDPELFVGWLRGAAPPPQQ